MGTTVIAVSPETPATEAAAAAETEVTAEVIELAAAAGAATEAARNAQADASGASAEISQLRTELGNLSAQVSICLTRLTELATRTEVLELAQNENIESEVVEVEPVAAPPAATNLEPKAQRGSLARMFLGK